MLRLKLAAFDHEAFKVLVVRYQGLVYAACKRYLNNNADVEDVFQQVFMALMENAPRVNTNLGGWLHRCATHKAISMVRSDVARKRRETARAVEDYCDDRRVVWNEVRDIIDECLNDLRPLDKEVIIQRIFLQNSQADIARSMGVSQQAVAKRVSKAIVILRAGLRGKGVVVSAFTLVFTLQEYAIAATVPARLTTVLMHTTTKWTVATGVTALTAAGGGITATTNLKVGAMVAVTALLVIAPSDQEAPVARVDGLTGTAAVEVRPPAATTASANPHGGRLTSSFDTFGQPYAYSGAPRRSFVNRTFPSGHAYPPVSPAANTQIGILPGTLAQSTTLQTSPPRYRSGPVSNNGVKAPAPIQNGKIAVAYQVPHHFEDLHGTGSVMTARDGALDRRSDWETERASSDPDPIVVTDYADDWADTAPWLFDLYGLRMFGLDEFGFDQAVNMMPPIGRAAVAMNGLTDPIEPMFWGGDFPFPYHPGHAFLAEFDDAVAPTVLTDAVDGDRYYADWFYDDDDDWSYDDGVDGFYDDDGWSYDDGDDWSYDDDDWFYDDGADWSYYDDDGEGEWSDILPSETLAQGLDTYDSLEFERELADLILLDQLAATGFDPILDDELFVDASRSLSDEFRGLGLDADPGIAYLYQAASSGRQSAVAAAFSSSVVTVVPEPGTLGLLALGAVALLNWRK